MRHVTRTAIVLLVLAATATLGCQAGTGPNRTAERVPGSSTGIPPAVRNVAAPEAMPPIAGGDIQPVTNAPIEHSYTFRKPAGCGPLNHNWGQRLTTCRQESVIRVDVHSDGVVTTAPLPDEPPRNPYPFELFRQWRYCPFAKVPNLDDHPEYFVEYHDAFVGTCYIYRPLPAAHVDALTRQSRFSMLDQIHPYIADAVKRMLVTAHREGIEAKVISGIRPYTGRYVTKTVKTRDRHGKVTKVKKKVLVKKPTQHAWGLAIDINLASRNDLASASRAFQNDPKERAAWNRLGELGNEYGLIWLGPLSPGEIFHFEWHPGLPGLLKGADAARASSLKRKGGLPAVWTMLDYAPDGKSAMRHLKD